MSTSVPEHLKHDWSHSKKKSRGEEKSEEEEEEEDDPVEAMLKKTGCLELHHAVQDCMAEHRDWRQCQKEVAAFRNCVSGKMPTTQTQQEKT